VSVVCRHVVIIKVAPQYNQSGVRFHRGINK